MLKTTLVTLLSTTVLTVSLNACKPKPPIDEKRVVVDIKKGDATIRKFAKKEYAGGKLAEKLAVYTIDAKLKSTDWVFDSFYNSENPPMPFFVGHVAAYQLEHGYTIFFANNRLKLIGGKPTDWTRLTITGDGTTATLYINGEKVSEGADDTAIGTTVQLGRGFSDRYWAGEFEYFDVYKGTDLPTDFSLNAPRLNGERVFSIEMAEDVKPAE